MKRCLVLLLLLLVAGAIVNVAVAWGCAIREPAISGNDPTIARPLEWLHPVPDHWPLPIYCGRSRCLGQTYSYRSVNEGPPNKRTHFQQDVFCTGLPMLSMEYECLQTMQDPASMTRTWKAAVDGSRFGLDATLFPIRPIWPGFAINTVFYAGVLWLLFAAPLALRKRRRIKRGLCPKCAYDLRGADSAMCPECGSAK